MCSHFWLHNTGHHSLSIRDQSLLLGLSLALLVIITKPDDLNDLLLVQVFEPCRWNHIVMVLLCEEQACLLQALAVESVRILEDLAHALNADVLGQYLFTSLLKWWHIESVRKLSQQSKKRRLNTNSTNRGPVKDLQREVHKCTWTQLWQYQSRYDAGTSWRSRTARHWKLRFGSLSRQNRVRKMPRSRLSAMPGSPSGNRLVSLRPWEWCRWNQAG